MTDFQRTLSEDREDLPPTGDVDRVGAVTVDVGPRRRPP